MSLCVGSNQETRLSPQILYNTYMAGRPLKFKTVEELEEKMNAYFDECDREEDTRIWIHGEELEYEDETICIECKGTYIDKYKLPTQGCMVESGEYKRQERYSITGLALALDTTRQTLVDYEEKDEFTDTIKKAKLRVENQYEIALQEKGRSGDIFALKNFKWQDKTETDVTTGGEKIDGFVVSFK